ncbi:hypothetical protein A4X06_0g1181 [Tilletia controversa]|uniref:Integrase catalytic domain-containing protein n=1 Tax=Tilletia controversa TaxID=13291 RepID=A0A8X7MY26_9BASI|nr:hypothetical protein A4X06_0g1181 [Tilletia controversa]
MCPDRSRFERYRELTGDQTRSVSVASGDSVPIVGIGTIKLAVATTGSNRTKILTLRNTLHVPGLAVNLISVPTLQLERTDVLFTKQGATIFTNNDELHANMDPKQKASVIWSSSAHQGAAHIAQEVENGSLPDPPEDPAQQQPGYMVGNERGHGAIAGADQSELRWADGPSQTGVATELDNSGTSLPSGIGGGANKRRDLIRLINQAPKGAHGRLLLYHRRFGHSGFQALAKAARRGKLDGLTESQVRTAARELQLCNSCIETRMARIKFGKRKTQFKSRNDLWHVDLVGPFQEIAGYQYFLTVVDEYSRRNWIRLLRTKGEAFSHIRDLCNLEERQTGIKLKMIRSDNGGEFTSNEAKQWARSNGIVWQYTTPYTSVQNGVAERMNRTIQERARALLHGAGAGHALWPNAVLSASHIINHLPSKAISDKIPLERWENREVDTSHLRVWGCVAWIKIHDAQRTDGKLSARGLRGMMVGYGEEYKAWMIFTPSHPTKKVHFSRDVRFDEGTRFVDTVLSEKNPMMPSAEEYEDMLEVDWEKSSDESVVIDTELAHIRQAPNSNSEQLVADGGWNNVSIPLPSTPLGHEHLPSLMEIDSLLSPHELLSTPLMHERLDLPASSPLPGSDKSAVIGHDEHVPDLRPSDPPAVPPGPPLEDGQVYAPMTERMLRAEQRHIARFGNELAPGFHALAVSLSKESEKKIRLSADGEELEPLSFREAKQRKDWVRWKQAMDEQLQALQDMHTWDLMELPPNRKAVGSRWVYKLKLDEDGKAARRKARLVAQGFSQVEGIDFTETFAPVARLDTLRALLAMTVHHGWTILQLDVVTAYLNGDLDEEVYMEQPPGYEKRDKKGRKLVCKLRLPLYGLKQAGRQWNSKFHTKLVERGYVQCKSEPCVYVRRNGGSFSIVLVYVDDVLVIAPNAAAADEEKVWLSKTFDMTDGGPLRHFLGIKIKMEKDRIILSQQAYIKAVLDRFNLAHERTSSTPGHSVNPLRAPDDYVPSREDIKLFAAMVGCLKWIAQTVRPDLSFICGVLSRFQARPTAEHIDHAKRALRFLRKTASEDLIFERASKDVLGLVGYTDSDLAGDVETSRSTTGFVFYIHGNPVSWSSRLQTSVAMSTVEAEYIALAEGLREGLWLRNLLTELGFPPQVPFQIHTDNEGTRMIAKNPEAHKRTKHIALRYHAVRERTKAGEIDIVRVDTHDNPADVLTKSLAGPKLVEARTKLHVVHAEVE